MTRDCDEIAEALDRLAVSDAWSEDGRVYVRFIGISETLEISAEHGSSLSSSWGLYRRPGSPPPSPASPS